MSPKDEQILDAIRCGCTTTRTIAEHIAGYTFRGSNNAQWNEIKCIQTVCYRKLNVMRKYRMVDKIDDQWVLVE